MFACVCCLFLFPLSRSLPSTSRYILIFLSLIHFFLLSPFVLDLRHTLLLHNHSCPLSPLLSLNLIFFFSLLFYPPFSFCFQSPSLSFSIGSPSSSSLLSFSLTLFILTLPSALYKLDWWLNPTCIKVRITIFATSTRAHTYTHTHTYGSRHWKAYSNTHSLCLPHTHYPFLSLTILAFTQASRLLAGIRFKAGGGDEKWNWPITKFIPEIH